MKVSVILLFFCVTLPLLAQTEPMNYDDPFGPFQIVRNHLYPFHPYKAVRILEKADTSRIQNKDFYGQAWMTALCFCGEIRQKEEVGRKIRTPHRELTGKEMLAPSVVAEPARQKIVEEARKTSVTMMNEAHLYPEHRVFVKSLLSDLYAIGYRHLCVEDLDLPSVAKDGWEHPQQTDGFYINEPAMGDLIREAVRIGFELHSYDAPGSSRRDSLAACNLLRIHKKNPQDKMLVFCGFAHNMEHRSSRCAASFFKQMSGWTRSRSTRRCIAKENNRFIINS